MVPNPVERTVRPDLYVGDVGGEVIEHQSLIDVALSIKGQIAHLVLRVVAVEVDALILGRKGRSVVHGAVDDCGVVAVMRVGEERLGKICWLR